MGDHRHGGDDGRHHAFAVELTRDFNLFPGLLVGSVAALAVTVLLMRRSILTEKLDRRGHHLSREYAVDPFELTRVREVMDHDVPTIPATMKVTELSDLIAQGDTALSRRQGTLLVDDQQQLAGMGNPASNAWKHFDGSLKTHPGRF